jgi:tetratricopeptide (TPR) repeat protein
MSSSGVVSSPVIGSGDRRFHWLKRMLWLQTALLLLMIATLIYVFWRFSTHEGKLLQENRAAQATIAGQSVALKQAQTSLTEAQSSLTNQEYNLALTEMRLNDPTDAKGSIEDAIRYSPTDPNIWREKAMILAKLGRAQVAINEMAQSKLDMTNGANLLTKAILYCSLNESVQATAAKNQALQAGSHSTSPWPSVLDREQYKSACHANL